MGAPNESLIKVLRNHAPRVLQLGAPCNAAPVKKYLWVLELTKPGAGIGFPTPHPQRSVYGVGKPIPESEKANSNFEYGGGSDGGV